MVSRVAGARGPRRAYGAIVVAIVIAGLLVGAASLVAARPTTAATPPVRGLALTGRSSTSISLYWVDPPRGRMAGVIVRRTQGSHAPSGGAAGVGVPTRGPRPVAVVDTGLTPGTRYSYAVFVRGRDGRISRAATIGVRTDAPSARPLAPPRLVVRSASNRLIIRGFAPVAGATGYSYRLCNGADVACGPATPISPRGHVIGGLAGGVRYTIRLIAIGDGVVRSDSPIAVRTGVPTGVPLPAPRFALTAGPGTLRIHGVSAVLHASGYRYLLCDRVGAGCGPARAISRAGVTLHGLAGGATYTVEVVAHGNGRRYADSHATAHRATVAAIPLSPPNSRNGGCAATTVAQENAKPGASGWRPPVAIAPPLVQGFAQSTSAACGGTVGIYLATRSTTPVAVHIQAWRVGYYQGAGGRLVWTSPVLTVVGPPRWETVDRRTDEVTAPWPRSATLTVPHAWTQGIYELRIVPVGSPSGAGAVPLVVRDDTRTTPMVQVVATNTDQMYNQWGGHSAYSSGTGVSTIVSLNRPYDGFGMAQILDEDAPLARFAESQARGISYLTDVDLDYGSRELTTAGALVVGSHSEYWTPRMRSHLETALARGANVAFFGANSIYWHAVPVTATGRYTELDIWKLNPADPNVKSPTRASTMWRLAPINNPEQKILGEQFGCTNVLMPMTVPSSPGWVFAGSGATPGQQLQGVIYQETDTPTSTAPMPAGTRVVTTTGTIPCPQRGTGTTSGSAMTLVPNPGHGLVVDVGTRGWVCLLDGSCTTNPVYSDPALLAIDPDIVTTTVRNDPTVEAIIRQATTNILNVMLSGPAAARATASGYPLAPGA